MRHETLDMVTFWHFVMQPIGGHKAERIENVEGLVLGLKVISLELLKPHPPPSEREISVGR